MTFQRARTQDQIEERKKEILNACKKIYLESGYDFITIDKISKFTSISRPALYNYYSTKEEIILELLLNCYLETGELLKPKFENLSTISKEEFSELLARTLSEQDLFLSLNSIYLLSLEKNCTQEALNRFRSQRQPFFETLHYGIKKFFPKITVKQENEFVIFLIALINGSYPITHLTDKQLKAMKISVPDYEPPKFYDICKSGIYKLIRDF